MADVAGYISQYQDYGLLGLFVICFVAATLYPLGSEAFVLGFLGLGFAPFSVWAVASAGNVLGSLSSYYLAYFAAPFLTARLKPKILTRIESAKPKVQKYGFIYAFFVFLPFVGDVFALTLGFVRYNQMLSILGIALGKMARYGLLILPFV